MERTKELTTSITLEDLEWVEELNDADLMAVTGGTGGVLGVVQKVSGKVDNVVDGKSLDKAINVPGDNLVDGGNLDKAVV